MRPRILRASNVVLLLLCPMYFLTYLDMVNINTVGRTFESSNMETESVV